MNTPGQPAGVHGCVEGAGQAVPPFAGCCVTVKVRDSVRDCDPAVQVDHWPALPSTGAQADQVPAQFTTPGAA